MIRCLPLNLCLGCSLVVLLAAACPAGDRLPPAAEKKVDFGRDIQPLLVKHCHACHGPDKQRGGLRLDRKADATAGGDSGPAFQAGKSADSRLIRLVSGAEPDKVMPPKGDRLSAAEIGLLRAWIDQGGVWSDHVAENRPAASHWAFKPVTRPDPPAVMDAAWVRNPIDRFVLARLEHVGVRPSPEADSATLIRRLHLDLTGLPPAPAEVEEFVREYAAKPQAAWERLVDRLLASPHFGERWGKHWLDLARYADSDGYGPDRTRPNAWRWRDWVIDAVNRDLPFDQFTVEQLAGDLLPDATTSQQVATGFHRHPLHNREAGTDQEEDRTKRLVDRVNTTGAVWLGLTLGCAECHSHKYDPIAQREYYQFFAFFNNADEVETPVPPTRFEQTVTAQSKAAYEKELKRLQTRLERRQAVLAKEMTFPAGATEDQKTELVKERLDEDQEAREIVQDLEELKKTGPGGKAVASALARTPTPRPTHVHVRGNFLQKGAEVTPGVPAALGQLRPRGAAPDRLDLARWLVDPANPLTARVAVNHFWQHLFGRGLVATPEDFGTQGEKPTHPELLDWLAGEYVSLGWSRKALLKRIVLSSTYRQASAPRRDLRERDPKNEWLARQDRFRLDAESVRDQYLAASGLLNRQVGGPSFRPPMPAGVRDIGFRLDEFYTPDKGEVLYRRGMYIFLKRGLIYPMLAAFDAPDTTEACTRRPRSNTPLQALTLLNDPLCLEAAQALGRRLVEEQAGTADDRVRHGFRLCLARQPDERELATLSRLHRDLVQIYRADPAAAKKLLGAAPPAGMKPAEAAAWVAVARTMLNLDELVTRE